jgi:serine/threonine protein kinase
MMIVQLSVSIGLKEVRTMQVKFSDGTIEQYEDAPLAAGAEGEIYRSRDKRSVIKLYFPDKARETERIERIDKLINEFNPTRNSFNSGKIDPYWAEFFTWPEKRITQPQVGFRMRFAGGLKTLEHYILPKAYSRLKPEERGWFIGRIAIAIKLAAAANRMSSMGLSYPDFSGKNVLVDTFSGRMVLIDCDSLTVPGKLPPTVEGTTWYRAPEIVTRSVTTPSVKTDRHALAVILYQWLLLWHPLRGDRKLTDDPDRDDQLCFGREALYIEHPKNAANRASKQIFKSDILGAELKELFEKAFVDGLHHPDRRPQPFQFQRALYRTYDHVIPCTSRYCDWRFFIVTSPPSMLTTHAFQLSCPRCGESIENPRTLPFLYLHEHKGSRNPDDYRSDIAHYIVGWHDRPLHKWHVRKDMTNIYTDATVIPDTQPCVVFKYDESSQQWYLQNLSLPNMRYMNARGTWTPCPVKTSTLLTTGMTIQFGDAPQHFRASIVLQKVV